MSVVNLVQYMIVYVLSYLLQPIFDHSLLTSTQGKEYYVVNRQKRHVHCQMFCESEEFNTSN